MDTRRSLRLLFVLLITCTAVIPLAAATETVYTVSLTYDAGRVDIAEVRARQGSPPNAVQPSNGYTVQQVSYNGSVLYERRFTFRATAADAADPDWFADNGTQVVVPNGTEETIYVNRTLRMPYHPTTARILVRAPNGTTVASAPTDRFAACNLDGVCSASETTVRCPQDCGGREDARLRLIAAVLGIAAGLLFLLYRATRRPSTSSAE